MTITIEWGSFFIGVAATIGITFFVLGVLMFLSPGPRF